MYYSTVYRQLYLIRTCEQKLIDLYPSDIIKSPIHLSCGQESVVVGICQALHDQDWCFGTYRSHALYLAKIQGNQDALNAYWAEMYGKKNGCCKGKGGSMHLAYISLGVGPTSAIVGATVPHAIGYAYAMKLKNKDVVTVSFFGDGAIDEGSFWESINFACLKNVPLLFVMEDNNFSVHTSRVERQAGMCIRDKILAFGLPDDHYAEWYPEDGIETLSEISLQFADQIRLTHAGPYFLYTSTYRYKEHVGPGEDWHLGYRNKEEMQDFLPYDPLELLPQKLGKDTCDQIHQEVNQQIETAIQFAEQSPFPDPIEIFDDVYASENFCDNFK